MKDDKLDYKMLRKTQQEEKSSPHLTKIYDRFFEEAKEYYNSLLKKLKIEENPSRNLIISEQIQNVEKIIRNIYELREKKIILAAISKARGGSPSNKHFLSPEKKLFSTVYTLLIENREQLLNPKIKNIRNPSNKDSSSTKIEQNEKTDVFTSESKPISNDHKVIRILETIPTFIGTDSKQYDLKKSDIVSVPENLASMLIKKKVAELVTMTP